MRAFVSSRYGGPDVLRLVELPRPEPGPTQVLVRVSAISVNAMDWHMLRGTPYLVRLTDGLLRPKHPVLGVDVAGVVEAVGSDVTHVGVGERVFGSRLGAFAEHVAGAEFVAMPDRLTAVQAAALPTAGMTALQALRDKGGVQPGQRVLILGAGGGVGTFAVQLALAFGAEVTAVTRADGVGLIRSLGAHEVVDHETAAADGIPLRGRAFDLVLDVAGRWPVGRLCRALTPAGTLVLIAAGDGRWAGPVLRVVTGLARSRSSRRTVRPLLATPNRADLQVLADLAARDAVTPVIDRTYPFDRIPDAVRHLEAGPVRGKVVIEVGDS